MSAAPLTPWHLIAATRTDLLHRMLLIRHLAELAVPAPLAGTELLFRVGEEAVAAGVWSALEPADLLVRGRPRCGPSPVSGVTVCLVRDGEAAGTAEWVADARRRRQPMLLCREHDRHAPHRPMVDGRDVEAMLATTRAGLRTARLDGADLLDVLVGTAAGGPDPVAVLASRMYADRQLDEVALRAIDDDASRAVSALTARSAPRTKGEGP